MGNGAALGVSTRAHPRLYPRLQPALGRLWRTRGPPGCPPKGGCAFRSSALLSLSRRSGTCRCRLLFRFRFVQILNDHRDAAIRSVLRSVRFAQALVGIAPHLGYLPWADPIFLHHAAGGIGAIRRKFPVAVTALPGKGFGVRVALDG